MESASISQGSTLEVTKSLYICQSKQHLIIRLHVFKPVFIYKSTQNARPPTERWTVFATVRGERLKWSGDLRFFGMPADQFEIGGDQSEAPPDPDVFEVTTDQLISLASGPDAFAPLCLSECLYIDSPHNVHSSVNIALEVVLVPFNELRRFHTEKFREFGQAAPLVRTLVRTGLSGSAAVKAG